MNSMRFGWMVAALGLAMLGCGGSDDEDKAQLEIIGEYTDQFDFEQVITATEWNGSAIKEYDNDDNVVYTQFPEDDEFSANLFAKTVYLEPESDGSFYYCMVVYDAETLTDAKDSDATADDSDPDTTGCGGANPWSLATKK